MARKPECGRSTARSTTWATSSAYVKKKDEEPGAAAASVYDGPRPDKLQRYRLKEPIRGSVGKKRGGLEASRACRLRIGSVNVGTLKTRSGEVVDMVARRKLDFCCIQEARWKGEGTETLGKDGARYKFFWKGSDAGESGVGILVAEKYVEKVVSVERLSDRLIVLRVTVGGTVLNIVSAYAPQTGRSMEEKEEFWALMNKTVSEISKSERLIVCGDMNGHVGEKADGFEGVHGGYGFGDRNVEGEMLLEFGEAMEFVILNTWFQKEIAKLVTYESGGCKSQIDYILVRKSERSKVKDVKVIPNEECIQQHKLLVCILNVGEQRHQCKVKQVSRCRIWKLKDASIQSQFQADVEEQLAEKCELEVKGVEGIWTKLKNVLLESADKACGRTKGRPKRKETWWWNEDVAKAVNQKRSLFNVWKKSKTKEDRAAYDQAKRESRRTVARAQEAGRKEFGEMLDRKNARGQVFKVAKQIVQKNKDVVGTGCIKDKAGKLATEDADIKAVWKDYFDQLLNEEFDWCREGLEKTDEVCGPSERITVSEVREALGKSKSGKAAGPTGVLVEMLKATGDVGLQWLTDLCNAIVLEGKIPDDWKESWMVSVYKGKGDALECGSYRGIKLLDQVMKIFERIIERRVRERVNIDNMQFGFRPGKGTTDAIFIVRQLQEKFLGKKQELWMAFVDLEKAFDRVPREVVWWALRRVGVEEWLVKVIMAMYEGVTTAIKVGGSESEAFAVKVGVHQGSVLSPLLFIIVLEALSQNFRVGLPWELLYADDLVLMAETEEKLLRKLRQWKDGFEAKGLKVNVGKTKVMRNVDGTGSLKDAGKYPCSVCRKGVGRNSILCSRCKLWVHKRCSGMKGQLKDASSFECIKCKNAVVVTARKNSVQLEQDVALDCVEVFCYLGDMIEAGGGAGEASRVRVRCAWKKFRELSPILTTRGASWKLKGKIYSTCVRSVMTYGSETWPMKVEDRQRLERAERMMVRQMCGVTLKDRKSSEELRHRIGIENVADVIRRGRLRWFGHVERKEDNDWVKACQTLEIDGNRGKGRGKKTWRQCVDEDMKILKLNKKDTDNRMEWRSGLWGDRLTRASAD